MKILISGGSGFLGSAFSETLTKRYQDRSGHVEITWLTRDTTQAHPDAIQMMSYDELANSDQYFDVVMNLAGAGIADKRWSDERKELLLASRIKPTQALLEFIAKSAEKPKLLLSGSAIGWYGVQGDTPLDESSHFERDFAHKLCEEWEQQAIKATDYGVPVAIVRTGVVIHPQGGMLDRLLTPFKLGLGGQLGDGSQIMSWIDRSDWVGAAIFIIEQHLSPSSKPTTKVANQLDTGNDTQAYVYNLTAPMPVSNHTFTKEMGAWLQRPTFFTLPAPVLKLMFGEMATLLLEGQKVLPKALLEAGYTFQYPTLKQALESHSV